MTITIDYETEERLDLPYEEIINNVVEEAIDYVECPYDAEVNVLLTDNEGIHQINLDMRQIDNPTDVLSFPMEDGEKIIGDIVLSLEKAYEQAEEYGHSPAREIGFLTVHSMLHLYGYDHIEEEDRVKMRVMEEKILTKLKLLRG